MWKANNSIKDSEQRNHLAVLKLSTLLRVITSKHHADSYYLNCLHFSRTESKLKFHEKSYKNKYFCGILMPSGKDKVL